MIRKVKIKDVLPNPFQPRKSHDPESIRSLADEIGKVGLWAGALRGREKGGKVELCFGHRRLDAVKLLGWKEVEVDVQKLSDEDMALQALIENLQREGLNDADRGDGIAEYIKLRRESKKDAAASFDEIMDDLGTLLGLSRTRLKELLRVANFDDEMKEPIRQQKIAGKTALVAERIGGAKAVKAVAEKEIGYRAMEAIQTEFVALPESTEQEKAVKEKVRQRFAKGEITKPEDVTAKARQFKAQSTRKEAAPPDLLDVMRGWTERATRWAGELDQVAPYIDYIDREPKVAERWRAAVKTLIEKLQKFS